MDRPIGRLLRAAQTADPEALVDTLSLAVAELGGSDVLIYLIDYEHATLIPHPDELPHGERPEPAALDGTMAGRAFLSSTRLASRREDGWHVWVPVVERADRLGVLSMTLPEWDEDVEYYCVELGYAAAHLLLASSRYTDLTHLLRRRKDLDLAAEMQWSLLPPLSFSVAGTTIAGLLEPAYEVGGDCFDYALNLGYLDLAVFDAVGHGLGSAVLASLVVGAYRNGRRECEGLHQLATGIDEAVRQYPGDPAFATALLARLNVSTGRLTWTACGHPQPLHVRHGTTLPEVQVQQGAPLGLGAVAPVIGEIIEVALEPGDGLLFYTDGVVDARGPGGEYFGEDRLRDLLEREHVSGRPPQEVLRRLVRSALTHQTTRLRDDASMLYLRWDGPEQA
ncbi:PP2C family protein-serine/threonine phosphatase [Vallicoccus soli]|uniref:Serine/threonine-protein phosphatase n=1 Tax=Vallicoccus soli TaxID=2339232 RepID=A0A3A3Z322_9ACTN|nr:PP2C family protein-serine/threonine phosphatase [Vallicoccus soli]RJK95925.1 serine/threonine-protein phosphatase [Vallicoccus soli]